MNSQIIAVGQLFSHNHLVCSYVLTNLQLCRGKDFQTLDPFNILDIHLSV